MAIVLIGAVGTGKSTVGKILSLNTSYKILEVGYLVKTLFYKKTFKENINADNDFYNAYKITNSYFFSKSKDFFVNKRLKFISNINKQYGLSYFLSKLLENNTDEKIIIIGVRNIEEIKTIKNCIKKPFFVMLKCSDSVLEKRFINREIERMDKQSAKIIFKKRRDIEIQNNLDGLESCANLIIDTDRIMPNDISKKILLEYVKFLNKGVIVNDGTKKIIYKS